MSRFKVGDKIRCIDAGHPDNKITVGSVYVATRTWPNWVEIVDDSGRADAGYLEKRFELVEPIKDPRAAEIEARDTEIERLKESLAVKEELVTVLREKADQYRLENDKYLAKNTELRAHLEDAQRARKQEMGQRLKLEIQLAAAKETETNLRTELCELRAERDALKPAAPTIVKQTWQGVFGNYNGTLSTYINRPETHWFDLSLQLLGYIRRDYYSSGKVVATLEPVEK